METHIEAQNNPALNPNQRQSDMDTIKGVLSEAENPTTLIA